MTSPSIEPKNTFFIDSNPNNFTKLLSNHAIKVINAIAKITPGIAYPDIDSVFITFNGLLFETLIP